MIALTDQERGKFADYCVQAAKEHGILAEWMEELSPLASRQFVERQKIKIRAFALVAKEINHEKQVG